MNRPSPLVLLLVLTMALIAALGYIALDAVRSYRRTTARILSDYAALAAASYARRIVPELDGYAFQPALRALEAVRSAEDAPDLPEPAPVKVWIDPSTEIPVDLVRYNFVVAADGAAPATIRGRSPSATVAAWLADTLRAHARSVYERDWPSAALFAAAGGEEHAIVYTARRDSAGAVTAAVGFEAEPAGLHVYFDYAMTVWPLVPPSLTGGVARDSLVAITVTSASGSAVYRSTRRHEGGVTARDSLGTRFGGLAVTAALHPDAGPLTVTAGPSRSHLALLVGLFAVTMTLMTATFRQIRREQELARLRSDFVSSVSHELRTPLAQIRLFIETLLLGRVRSVDEERRSLEIIGQEAMRLSHLVDNVLHVSRSDRRAIHLSLEEIDLAALVRETAESFEPLASARAATLRVAAADRVIASVDPAAARQVVINLLDNAVKYGPPGQTVAVGLALEDGVAALSIEDEGPGVPPRDRERVWERFARLERAAGTAVAGTGIGLSVVRELVTLMGGSARVEDAPGGGARFVVTFPRS
jgi:signal transduction histidine kinase